ncbi:MAG: hypothetical protein ACTS6G_02055 [Candidatus Hodgkinia cicadicola]
MRSRTALSIRLCWRPIDTLNYIRKGFTLPPKPLSMIFCDFRRFS